MTEIKIFYILVTENGLAFENCTVDKITVNDSADVFDLRKAIKAENENILPNIVSSQMVVFKNKEEFGNKNSLKNSSLVNSFNTTEENALLVLVPSLINKSTSTVMSQSLTSISCKSFSSSGRCRTGRHVNRQKDSQAKFRKKLLKRDKGCIATGVLEKDKLTAAHILPLEKSHMFERKYEYSPQNGVLLRSDLENDYDLHKWYFTDDGTVVVLFKHWPFKDIITKVNLATGDNAPSSDLIKKHNEIALEEAKHYCPHCWKYVGEVNIKDHESGSCEKLNDSDYDDSDEDDSDHEDRHE